MDKKDRILLSELSLNARIPIKTLAKKLQLSESSTIYRIERLKKQDILIGTHVILNPYKLGRIGYRINFSLKNTFQNSDESLILWLKTHKDVQVLAKGLYKNEYIIMSWVKSISEFEIFVDEFKLLYGDFISNLNIFSYTSGFYFARKYLADTQRDEIEASICKIEAFDSLDISILLILVDDARISSLTVAQKLNKDVQTIINRIKEMQKKQIIMGYGCNLNIENLGFSYYKLNIIFSNKVPWGKLIEYARCCANTVYIDKTISSYDFEINVEVESGERLQGIIKDLEILGSGMDLLEVKQIEKYEKLTFI